MNILVLGSGGREHALAWKLLQSAGVEKVFVAPGNAGTATEPGLENVAIDPLDFPALADFVRNNKRINFGHPVFPFLQLLSRLHSTTQSLCNISDVDVFKQSSTATRVAADSIVELDTQELVA